MSPSERSEPFSDLPKPGTLYLLEIRGDPWYTDEDVLARPFKYHHERWGDWQAGPLSFETLAGNHPRTSNARRASTGPFTLSKADFKNYCKEIISPTDLTRFLHWPWKAPEFDRMLMGDSNHNGARNL